METKFLDEPHPTPIPTAPMAPAHPILSWKLSFLDHPPPPTPVPAESQRHSSGHVCRSSVVARLASGECVLFQPLPVTFRCGQPARTAFSTKLGPFSSSLASPKPHRAQLHEAVWGKFRNGN